MGDWVEKKLSEVCTISIGGTPARAVSEYWDVDDKTENFWVSIRDMNQKIIQRTSEKLSQKGIQNSNAKLVRKGTVLMSFKLSIGKVSIAGSDLFTNEAIAALETTDIDRKFLFHGLHYWDLLQGVDQAVKGATLNKEKLKKIKFKIPESKQEQSTIATILTTIDQAIEKTEQLIAKYERIKTGLMQDLLTRGIDEQGNIRSEETHEFKDSVLGRIPKEWEVVEQKSIVDFVNGRAYKLSEWEKEGTPVIRLQNLTGNGDSYYYSNLKLPEKQYVNHGDLLYMWSATFGAVIWQGAKAIFHYHIWRVVVSSIIDLKFMYYKLCDLTQKLLHQSNGSTMLHVTKEYMEKYLVVIPKDVDEQKKIAEAITSFDERLEHEKAQLNKLKFLKTGLMQDLLTGKVRVDALINKAQETI